MNLRRILALVLSVLMLVSALPLNAIAEEMMIANLEQAIASINETAAEEEIPQLAVEAEQELPAETEEPDSESAAQPSIEEAQAPAETESEPEGESQAMETLSMADVATLLAAEEEGAVQEGELPELYAAQNPTWDATATDPYIINVAYGEADDITQKQLYALLDEKWDTENTGLRTQGGFKYGETKITDWADDTLAGLNTSSTYDVYTGKISYSWIGIANGTTWTKVASFKVVEAAEVKEVSVANSSITVDYNMGKTTAEQWEAFRNAIIAAVGEIKVNDDVVTSDIIVKFHHKHTASLTSWESADEYLELNAANASEYDDTEDKASFTIGYGTATPATITVTLKETRNEADITVVNYTATVKMNGAKSAAAQEATLTENILKAVVTSSNHDATPEITVEETGVISGWFPLSYFLIANASSGATFNVGQIKNIRISWTGSSIYNDKSIDASISLVESRQPAGIAFKDGSTKTYSFDTWKADEAKAAVANDIVVTDNTGATVSNPTIVVTLNSDSFGANIATITVTSQGDEYVANTTGISENVTFTQNTYNATWNANGGAWTDGDTTKTVFYAVGAEIDEYPAPAREHYTFAGWDGFVEGTAMTNAGASYNASWTPVNYTITWVNGDETTTTEVAYDATPVAPPASKTSTAQYHFTNGTWGEIAVVTGDATYTATFTEELRSYTITWVNGNGSTKTTTVNYGETPVVPEDFVATKPAKTDEAGNVIETYTDVQWPATSSVIGEATYTVTYTTVPEEYTITWNADGGYWGENGTAWEEGDEKVYNYTSTLEYGSEVTAPANPTKEADGKYTYSFQGWDYNNDGVISVGETAPKVTNDVTYNAIYSTTDLWDVTVVYGNGTDNATGKVEDGKTYTIPDAPTRSGYRFMGWYIGKEKVEAGDEITITADTTITASWSELFTITWKNDGKTYLTETDKYIAGETPVAPAAPSKKADDQYTYTFAGWDPAVDAITGDTTYTAVYTKTVNQYTVTFVDENGNELNKQTLDYGATPEYKGEKLEKQYYSYSWSPAIATVTGDAAYKLVWIANKDTNTNGVADELETATVTVVIEGNGTVTLAPAGNATLLKQVGNVYTYLYDSTNAVNKEINVTANPNDPNATDGSVDYVVSAPATVTVVDGANTITVVFGTRTLNANNGEMTVNKGKQDEMLAELKTKILTAAGLDANGDYTVTAEIGIQLLNLVGTVEITDGDAILLNVKDWQDDLVDEDALLFSELKDKASYNFTITANATATEPAVSKTVAIALENELVAAKVELNYVNGSGFDTQAKFEEAVKAAVKVTDNNGNQITNGTVLPIHYYTTITANNDGTYTAVVTVNAGETWAETTATFTGLTWVVNQYTVTFVDEDGKTELGKEKYNYNTAIAQIKIPEVKAKNAYDENGVFMGTRSFTGWTPEIANVTKDATYTAVYSEEIDHSTAKYTITWNAGEGAWGTETTKETEGVYGDPIPAPAENPKHPIEDMDFIGWDGNKDCSPDVLGTIAGDAEYTAVYADVYYVVTYVLGEEDDGSLITKEIIYQVGDAVTDPGLDDRADMVIEGWYDENGDKFDFGPEAVLTSNITLTANWVAEINNNDVLDTLEEITVNIVGHEDEGNGDVTIEGAHLDAEGNWIYDSDKAKTFTVVATPEVVDGVSKSYVSAIEVVKADEPAAIAELEDLDYSEDGKFIASKTIEGASGNYIVHVTFTACDLETKENASLPFYQGIDDPDAEELYNAAISDSAYNAEYVKNVQYLARPAGEYSVTIPVLADFKILGQNLKIGGNTITVPLTEAWLNVGDSFETVTEEQLQQILDDEIDAIKAKIQEIYGIGISPSNATAIWAKVEEIYADIENLTTVITNEAKFLGYHAFGENGENAVIDENGNVQETLYIEYVDDAKRLVKNDVVITLIDDRTPTTLIGGDVEFEYDEYDNAAILNAITLVDDEGNAVEGEVDLLTELSGKDVGEYTYKAYYDGSKTHKPCTVEFTLNVVKAPANIDVPNVNTTYGEGYNGKPVVTNKHGETINANLIEVFVGVDVAAANVEGNGLTGVSGKVQLIPSKDIRTILALIGLEEGATYTLSEISEILNGASGLLEQWGLTEQIGGILSDAMDKLAETLDGVDVEITIGGSYPTDIGVYLHGAVVADSNYETAFDMGYLLIAPKTTEIELTWAFEDDNFIVTLPLAQDGTYLKALADGADNEYIEYLYLFCDAEGNIELVHDDSAEITECGAYIQIAYILNWGNETVYAKPIVRPFVVVPEVYNVTFEDANENNARIFAFDNTAKEMKAIVTDRNGDVVDKKVEYTYVGMQTNTEVWNESYGPTHAGAYAVLAVVYDEQYPTLPVGMAIGAMLIKPSESTIDVNLNDDNVRLYDVVNAKGGVKVEDVVTAASVNVAAPYTPDVTTIVGKLAIEEGTSLENMVGNVNVDLPVWLEELLGIQEGTRMSAETLTAKLAELAAQVDAAAAEQGISTQLSAGMKSLAENIARIDSDVTLTFGDQQPIKEIGAYLIVGIVTDSDHIPSIDADYLMIVPEIMTVEFIDDNQNVNYDRVFEFNNEAHTMPVRVTDMDGNAVDVTEGALTFTYAGIKTNGQLLMPTNDAPVNAGAYAVNALYVETNDAGVITAAGTANGAMLITPAAAEVVVDNDYKLYDGIPAVSYKDYNDADDQVLVTVKAPTVAAENYTPDTTTITVALVSEIDTENVKKWETVDGSVNVDLPAWLDAYIPENIANGVERDTAMQYLTALAEREEIAEVIKVMGADNYVDALIETITDVVDLLDLTTLSFNDTTVGTGSTAADNPAVSPTEVGAYLIVTVVTDSDHYPAMDSGLLVIAPAIAEITLEDFNHNNQWLRTYNNQEQAIAVEEVQLYNGSEWIAGDKANVTIYYTGVESAIDVETNAEGVNEIINTPAYLPKTQGPSETGAYVVTAVYHQEDNLGYLQAIGMELGVMVIQPAKAEIEVAGGIFNTDDGITANGQVKIEAATTDAAKTVITTGLNLDKELLKAALSGEFTADQIVVSEMVDSVNFTLPGWLDELVGMLVEEDDISIHTLIAAIQDIRAAYVQAKAEVKDLVKENYDAIAPIAGAVAEILDLDPAAVLNALNMAEEDVAAAAQAVIDALEQYKDVETITFFDDVALNTPGIYMVMGLVTDSDYLPAAAANIIIIAPDAADVQLTVDTDNNNIFYRDRSNTALGATVNGEANTDAVITYTGVATDGKLTAPTSTAPTAAGVYLVAATYLETTEDGELLAYGADAGILVVAPDTLSLDIPVVMGESNLYTYDGAAKAPTANIACEPDCTGSYQTVATAVKFGNTVNINLDANAKKAITAALDIVEKAYESAQDSEAAAILAGIAAKAGVTAEDVAKVKALLSDTMNSKTIDKAAYEAAAKKAVALLKGVAAKAEDLAAAYAPELTEKVESVIGAEAAALLQNYAKETAAQLKAYAEKAAAEIKALAEDKLGDVETITINGQNPVDAGAYTFYAVGYLNSDHTIAVQEGTLTIEKQAVQLTIANKEMIYGDEEPELTYTTDPAVTLNGVELVREDAENKNVGTYAITATVDAEANPNYDVTVVDGTFTIKAKEITEADVALDGALTYTGEEQTQNITVTEGVTYEVTGNTGTDAGTYILTVTGTGNYTGSVELSWSIAKKAIIVEAEDQVISVGNFIEADAYTVKDTDEEAIIVDGMSVKLVVTNEEDAEVDYTVAGTYSIKPVVEFSIEIMGNYEVEEIPAVLTVNANIGIIEKGVWRMDLDAVTYLRYYPTVSGFDADFDFAGKGGMLVWTGDYDDFKSRNDLEVGKPNTKIVEGWRWDKIRNEWYVRSHEYYAKNLGDGIIIRPFIEVAEGQYVYMDGEVGATGYSPAVFCYDKLKDVNVAGTEEERTVCAALLRYGAAAQEYFGYETDNLVTTIPNQEDYKVINLDDYKLDFDSDYLDPINKDSKIQGLANTLSGKKEGIIYKNGSSSLDLRGAIRFAVGYYIDDTVIDWNNVQKAEVLFWNEDALLSAESLEYDLKNYTYSCTLTPATGDETVLLGDYRGLSDYILAKKLSDTVYYSVRVEVLEGEEIKVYRSGLTGYSPEAFVSDILAEEENTKRAELCRRIAVYGEMAKRCFD